MSGFSLVYKEFVYGGHLLALGTASIASSAAYVLGKGPSWDLLLMAYLFSFGAYTLNRASDFEEDRVSHPERTSYLEARRRQLPVLAVASFALGYALALARNLLFFFGLLLPLLLAIAYSVGSKRLVKVLGFARLKEGLLVKNMAVSFGWSLIPVLVGLYYLELPIAVLALCPFIFMRLMVNTIFFDARDVIADVEFGVRTLPSSIGLARSWRLMNAIDIASAAYVAGLAAVGVLPAFAAVFVLFTPYSLAYRYYSLRSTKHGNSLRDLVADGEYLFWGILTYVSRL